MGSHQILKKISLQTEQGVWACVFVCDGVKALEDEFIRAASSFLKMSLIHLDAGPNHSDNDALFVVRLLCWMLQTSIEMRK